MNADLMTAAPAAGIDASRGTGPADRGPRGARWFLPLAVLAAVLLRFTSLVWPLTNDEAGFLMVSRAWHPAPENMYGTYWVDRPPVLIWAYRLGDLAFGTYGARVLACVLVAVMVVALYRAGRILGGETGGRWAAVGTIVVVSNPYLQTWTGKGEMLGVPLVAVSCWCSLAALRRYDGRNRLLLVLAAGFLAALACGFKQSLLGGFVLGGALLVLSVARGRIRRREGLALAGVAAVGAALPALAVVAWATSRGVHLHAVWDQVFGFRSQASAVLASGHLDGPRSRAWGLARRSVVSGIVPVMAWFAVNVRTVRRQVSVEYVAVAVMFGADVAAAAAGGSYWSAYLVPLIPSMALGLALLSRMSGRRRRASQVLVVLVAASTLWSLTTFTVHRLTGEASPTSYSVGTAIRAASQPGDTVVSLYGDADVVAPTGLPSPYPHLWSLPIRTLDPRLTLLRATLRGPDAPTWVVAQLPVDSWDLDAGGRLQHLLDTRYVALGDFCGHQVWLRAGASRPALTGLDCHYVWSRL